MSEGKASLIRWAIVAIWAVALILSYAPVFDFLSASVVDVGANRIR